VNIIWTRHALERFVERALLYGFSRTEFEVFVKKQEVRISKGFDELYKKEKFETIGLVAKKFFTVHKAEDNKTIIVITLWESNAGDVDLWFLKQK